MSAPRTQRQWRSSNTISTSARPNYCVRTSAGGDISLTAVGYNKGTGSGPFWILIGADAWNKNAPADFPKQHRPYRSSQEAQADAPRIFPKRADFERFLACGVNGVRVERDGRLFGPPFVLKNWDKAVDSDIESNNGVPDGYEEDVHREADADPVRRARITEIIARDRSLAAGVKAAADYTCERCARRSEWLTASGVPYCETHHLIPLGLDGSDEARNLMVLCADCHRRLHYADGGLEESREIFEARDSLGKPIALSRL